MSEEFIRFLAELINGDVEDLYSYKSGPKIVRFFNQNFGYNDIYGQGFPSRWVYTYNKIVELINKNSIDKLFNIILNKRFIMIDLKFSEQEALERENEIVNKINDKAVYDNCYLVKRNGEYKFLNKEEDLEWIAGGGFADIYFQKSTNKILKKLKEELVLDKGIRSRFKREYEITKSLEDLNGIIKVFDFNENDYSYTMERAEKDLYKYIIENELNENQKLTCIYQILDIMSKVHERGIIHRDISPKNVLILNGTLKISDFGLGKDLKMLASHQTINTNALGQILYCAPEQLMLLREGDTQSDIFSLGRMINFIMNKDPIKKNHILRSVVEKATSETPSNRYSKASDLYDAVKKSIEFSTNKNRIENIKEAIKNNEYNQNIEDFIYEQTAENLLDNLTNLKNFKNTILTFVSIDNRHASYFLESIGDKYIGFYYRFDEYDNLADIMYEIIIGNYEFPVKESAAKILRFIAKDINRINAQILIDRAIEKVIDPFIEEELI